MLLLPPWRTLNAGLSNGSVQVVLGMRYHFKADFVLGSRSLACFRLSIFYFFLNLFGI